MNIAFITSEYPHLRTGTSGGIGTSIKNLASSLVKASHGVHVVVIGQKEDATFSDNGITIHQLKNRKWKGLSWWLTAKKIEKKINQLCQEESIELVEVQDYLGILAFVSCYCKTVLKLHGSDTYFCHLDKRPVKWWNKFQEKRAFKKADAIVAVSQFAGDLSNLVFSSNRQFEVIGNGIDSNQFVPAPPNGNNTIMYFGTLIRKKGVLELAAIFNKVYAQDPTAILILAGRDTADITTGATSTWEVMQPLFTKQARQNVRYKGEIPYSEIKKEIATATVCVFPSLSETFGMVTIEAMACSKPVITSNFGWTNEIIIHEKEGFLIDPKNHKVFAATLLRLLQDPVLQKEIGTNARIKIEESFTNEIIAQKTIAFYKKIIVE